MNALAARVRILVALAVLAGGTYVAAWKQVPQALAFVVFGAWVLWPERWSDSEKKKGSRPGAPVGGGSPHRIPGVSGVPVSETFLQNIAGVTPPPASPWSLAFRGKTVVIECDGGVVREFQDLKEVLGWGPTFDVSYTGDSERLLRTAQALVDEHNQAVGLPVNED